MARNLTGTTAATQKDLASYQLVWIVEIDADEPDVGATTLYYASREITISGHLYADELAENGITLPWHRFRPWGGVAQIGSAEIRFKNEGGLSAIADTYALDNDPVRIGVVFVTGAETSADIIWLWRGVIEDDPRDIQEFKLTAIDTTEKRLQAIPSKVFSPSDYPNIDLGLIGQGLPILIGNKAVNNLVHGHFQREDRRNDARLDSGVLNDIERQRRLAHAGPAGNDYQLRPLKARGQAVEIAVTRRHARDELLFFVELLDRLETVADYVLERTKALMYSPLGDLKNYLLCAVQILINITLIVIAPRDNIRGAGDKVAYDRLLPYDLAV